MMNLVRVFMLGILCSLSTYAMADWRCYTVDQGGHYWMSTGMTQERAMGVAMNFCTAHSPNGKTCQVDKCKEI